MIFNFPAFPLQEAFLLAFKHWRQKKTRITWAWAKKNKNLISCRHKFKPGLISKSSGLNKLLWNLKAVQQTFERERLTWAWKEPSFWTLRCIQCLRSNLEPYSGILINCFQLIEPYTRIWASIQLYLFAKRNLVLRLSGCLKRLAGLSKIWAWALAHSGSRLTKKQFASY